MSEQPDPVRVAEARHLILIARNLRAAGDMRLVQLHENGISDTDLTLAGELELIAIQLDMEGCLRHGAVDPDGDPWLSGP